MNEADWESIEEQYKEELETLVFENTILLARLDANTVVLRIIFRSKTD